MLKHLLMVAAVFLCSCATIRDPKAGRDFALAGIALDVGSTLNAVDRGCVETNPLYGDLSSSSEKARFLAINAGTAYFVWLLGDYLHNGTALWIAGAIRGGTGIHNMLLDCH